MRTKYYYVGLNINAKGRTVFSATVTPSEETHSQKYGAVIGPFQTKAAAILMAEHGYGNPHMQTVGDAERIAKAAR